MTCRQCGSWWYFINGRCNRCGYVDERLRADSPSVERNSE